MKPVIKKMESCTIDKDTGEIKAHQYTSFQKVDNEPSYWKTYDKNNFTTKKLVPLTHGQLILLFCLLSRMNYQNEVYIIGATKKAITEISGIVEGTIRNNLMALCEAGVLKRVSQGLFLVNPLMFSRGSWKDILQVEF